MTFDISITPHRQHIDYSIRESDLTIFEQHWWLELAKGSTQYRELCVRREGAVVGRLSFIVVRNKLGNQLGFPPIWSHLGSPVLSQALNSEEKAEVLEELLAQIARNMSYKFVLSPAATDSRLVRYGFENAGFTRSTEPTYLQYPDDVGILERLKGESRRQIVSASKTLDVVDLSADEFINFYKANLTAAGKQSYAELKSVHSLIVHGGSGDFANTRVIAVKRRQLDAPLEAAIAYAWDSKRYYLWLMTYRRGAQSISKTHPHAVKLLILLGTEDARNRGLIFDADGGATWGSETLYRDRLKFPHIELREVYTRDTGFYALYKRLRIIFRSGNTRAFSANGAREKNATIL